MKRLLFEVYTKLCQIYEVLKDIRDIMIGGD